METTAVISSASWYLSQAVVTSILLLISLFLFMRAKLTRQKQRGPPPFEGIPLVPGAHWLHGHISHILRGQEGLSHVFSDYANEEGLCSFWLREPTVSVLDASDARAVLRQGSERKRMTFMARHLARALGEESLIFSQGGHSWTKQRMVVQYAFSAPAMVDYRLPVFEVVGHMAASLKKMCERGEASGKRVEINVTFLSSLFALDVFGRVALGHDFQLTSDSDDYAPKDAATGEMIYNEGELLKPVQKSAEIKAAEFFLDDLALRCNPSSVFKPGLQLYWLPTKRNRERKQQMAFLKTFLGRLIKERKDEVAAKKSDVDAKKNSQKARDNMLTRLISKNEDASAEGVIQNLITFLIAGFDTTSVTVAYALYNLSTNKRCQERCADEARRIFAKSEAGVVIDEHEFKYIYAALMESMRLTPTVLLSHRQCTKPINIGKVTIPVDSTIYVPLSCILKSERNFQRANEFCPERWVRFDGDCWVERDALKEQGTEEGTFPGPKSENSKYQDQNIRAETISAGNIDNFVAFSHGVRDCVGKRLARLETTIFIAFIMKDFIVEYDDTHNPLEMKRRLVTFFPQHLPIIFRKRE